MGSHMKKQPNQNDKSNHNQKPKGYNQSKKPLPQPKEYEEIEY